MSRRGVSHLRYALGMVSFTLRGPLFILLLVWAALWDWARFVATWGRRTPTATYMVLVGAAWAAGYRVNTLLTAIPLDDISPLKTCPACHRHSLEYREVPLVAPWHDACPLWASWELQCSHCGARVGQDGRLIKGEMSHG